MVEITAALVKALRDQTGVGMMDCKKALLETGGDMDQAVDWLRKEGLAAAAKKAGRIAAEGLIGLHFAEKSGALVEVNSETDFVARNEAFQNFVRTVTGIALDFGGEMTDIQAAPYTDTGRTVAEELTNLIATLGENLSLRRSTALTAHAGVVTGYLHNRSAEGLGKIGVLVALESKADAERLAALGKQIAMHIAAARPEALTIENVDPDMLERERGVLTEQARASGKPDAIIEKMVDGRLRKYFEEVVLLEQTWVIDNERKVSGVLEAAAKDLGTTLVISGFVRFALGEGIEREAGDFAADVAAQLSR